MKKILLFILVFNAFLAKAQVSGSFTINWTDKTKLSYDTFSYNVPQFQIRNFYFDPGKKSVLFIANISVTSAVDEKSLKITNPIYETITRSQLGDLNLNSISNDLKAAVRSSKARNLFTATLSLSPIIKDGSGFKMLKSFSYYIVEKNITEQFGKKAASIQNSVLASGDWYRFYIERSGVYKIPKTFLQQLGMNLDNVDPRNIKLYGNGGRMLPLLNSVDYPLDLAENAIRFVGEEDGVFNNQDYILFYAEGLDNWSEENLTHNNLYSSKSYYYITAGGNSGKRIAATAPAAGGTPTPISVFDDYQYHEKDLTNFARIGRKWYGEQFGVTDQQSFSFNIPNIVSSVPVNLNIVAAGVGFNDTSLTVIANSNPAGTIPFSFLATNSGNEGSEGYLNTNIAATDNIKIDLKFNNNGVPSSNCYLDYIVLKAVRNLTGYGKQFRFQYNQAANLLGTGQFQISNASSIAQVWDITDIYNVTKYENSGQSNFSFLANLGEVRKYIAVDGADLYSPLKDSQSKVANQNIKGTIFKNSQGVDSDIDYLIVTPAFLNGSAEKLANFHRTHSNLNVKVVNLENIYQEFSSGKQDIGAIRNFVKYVYNNASSESKRVQYLNLFGDASFDFQNRIPNNTNVVPIFHTLPLLSSPGYYINVGSTFISDDFFVLLDEDEGNMNATNAKGLDVAVGRMLVSSVSQAEEMVNKVIEYHDVKSFGRWRNNFTLISDDVDADWEAQLEQGIDALGDEIFSQKPFINVKKIHSDAYVQETSAGGNRYPKAHDDILKAFDQGAMVIDYFGHGGEDGLASERIFESADAQNLKNRYKYPLFVTMTCEFTRFDNPYRPTCGEYMYWNAQGGAVSLVTTTRQISVITGQAINEDFAKYLFGFGTNELYSIAEALRMAKIAHGSNPLEVFYIGDPALKLSMAKPKIVLTKVNDVSISQTVDVLKALSTIKLSGEVRDETGSNLMSDYNGDLAVNIYDKAITRTTLGNDGTTDSSGKLITLTFNNLGETIFRGNASVTNGLFEFSFVVPKDIRIPVGNGRVSFYAKKNNQLMDQTGEDTSIQVGGINANAVADNTAPTAKLYMNDQTFISGGITNASPIFLAFLEDENGINTASGIGHDITAVLDGDVDNPVNLNEYYETEENNFKKGKVKFQFRNLSPGLHTISFKAWDVYNNPITAEIQFVVVGDEEIVLKNVLNYPNPFVNYTQFWFSHNKPFEPLEVQVQVMTITGKVVWTKNQTITTDGFLSKEISWDGKDDFGDSIGKGVYVYKLTVRSTLSDKKAEKFEKLVIL